MALGCFSTENFRRFISVLTHGSFPSRCKATCPERYYCLSFLQSNMLKDDKSKQQKVYQERVLEILSSPFWHFDACSALRLESRHYFYAPAALKSGEYTKRRCSYLSTFTPTTTKSSEASAFCKTGLTSSRRVTVWPFAPNNSARRARSGTKSSVPITRPS
jgi:hypothetical protein